MTGVDSTIAGQPTVTRRLAGGLVLAWWPSGRAPTSLMAMLANGTDVTVPIDPGVDRTAVT